MNKFFSRKRVLAIGIVIVLVVVISLLPPLGSKTQTSISPATPNTPSAAEIEAKVAKEAMKAKWRNLDPMIPVQVWSVHSDYKELTGKSTIGLLLTTKPEGFSVEPPPNLSPTDGLVIARILYAGTRIDLLTKSRFDQVFASIKEEQPDPDYFSISSISKMVKGLENSDEVKSEDVTIPIIFVLIVVVLVIGVILLLP